MHRLHGKIFKYSIAIGTSVMVASCSSGDQPLPPITVSTSSNPVITITYSHKHDDLKLDIQKPDAKTSLHRGILLIHGGGWVGGNRTEMNEIGGYFSNRGFLVASVDYRLAPKNHWPAQLEDVQCAVRYLRSHAKDLDIEPKKIGAAGISAGGHLSAFLGSVDGGIADEYPGVSSRVQAVCSISGIHDLTQHLTVKGDRYKIIQQLLGETGPPNGALRAKASPIDAFDKNTAPTMFIQGKEDMLVPAEQTNEATAKLKQIGIPTEAIFVDRMGHGLSPLARDEAKALDEAIVWMKKYLAI